METPAIGPAGTTLARRDLGSLTSEDFFRILVTELQQQDPFEPAKTSDMISQISQIRSIELSGRLTDTLENLTRQQRVSGASELIGKYISAVITEPSGGQVEISGLVTGVRFNADGTAVLELDNGNAVPVSSVQWITTVEANEEQAAAESTEPASEQEAKTGATEKSKQPPPRNWLNLGASLNL